MREECIGWLDGFESLSKTKGKLAGLGGLEILFAVSRETKGPFSTPVINLEMMGTSELHVK